MSDPALRALRSIAVIVLVGLLGCSRTGDEGRRPSAAPLAGDSAVRQTGDQTMMFIEIEGTKDELRSLSGIEGLELERGADDLGGGRFKVGAFVQRQGALLDLQARKLTVRIIMDEAEVKRRIENERGAIRRASDAGASLAPSQSPPTNTDDDVSGRGPKGSC